MRLNEFAEVFSVFFRAGFGKPTPTPADGPAAEAADKKKRGGGPGGGGGGGPPGQLARMIAGLLVTVLGLELYLYLTGRDTAETLPGEVTWQWFQAVLLPSGLVERLDVVPRADGEGKIVKVGFLHFP
jgi:hypothetical protein